jgi:hypothetical protein
MYTLAKDLSLDIKEIIATAHHGDVGPAGGDRNNTRSPCDRCPFPVVSGQLQYCTPGRGVSVVCNRKWVETTRLVVFSYVSTK